MRKKEIIAMLLAGGQGSRMGILSQEKAKPAIAFGGKYRIIDFPMSNCINSGIDTVGVMTQYQPLLLNKHIGIGIPWDLDRSNGGVTILAPHVKGEMGEFYSGSANAAYQNIDFIDAHNPEYVLILGGDHIYKMDYSKWFDFHKKNNCDCSIAVKEVPIEEASRFGIMNTREDDRVYEFEEKPKKPKSNLASMGNYIFRWDILREALITVNKAHPDADFGKHVIPLMLEEDRVMYAYRFQDYWMDVGTLESYWVSNMDLIKTLPDFNLYEDFWKIYTDADHQPPQYLGPDCDVRSSILSEGCQVYGRVYNSVLGPGVLIEDGAIVRDSIVMGGCVIGKNSVLDRCIIDENSRVGSGVVMGVGDNVPNEDKPKIYDTGLTVVGERSVVPDGVTIGKNCVIYGATLSADYPGSRIESGKSVIRYAEEVI
ncbi:MAG: glucose-1-phosphate adenylyltransferase [Firmicutes bacterium]|nr:glucose-1-phosphate adenylyltransferase [Bacillota bacterium]